jgi:hypothetical protein
MMDDSIRSSDDCESQVAIIFERRCFQRLSIREASRQGCRLDLPEIGRHSELAEGVKENGPVGLLLGSSPRRR